MKLEQVQELLLFPEAAVVADKAETTLLMFIEQEKTIIPVSSAAFRVTQSSRRRLKSYNGALVVSRDGKAVVIDHIEIIQLWGSSFIRKVISALTGAWEIRTHFRESEPVNLNDFKQLVTQYLRFDNERAEPFLPQTEPLESVLAAIEKASSFSEVFTRVCVPEPQDSLDVL